MRVHQLWSINVALPHIVHPGEDESPTSWLIRLARMHQCDVPILLEHCEATDLLKTAIDVEADWRSLTPHLNTGSMLPNGILAKIATFEWERGRSNWLVYPNRKGGAYLNSFTKYCPHCLKDMGYYQLKWKLTLVEGCVTCARELLPGCPKCKQPVNTLKSDRQFPPHLEIDPMHACSYCEFDLRKGHGKYLGSTSLDKLLKITKAYGEDPVNLRYLDSFYRGYRV